MLTSLLMVDPRDEFRRHWEWHEIPWEAAIMRCSFVPVIMVSNSSGRCEVTWLSAAGLRGLSIVPHFQQRYFVQVGARKAASAVSPIPHAMQLSADGADFIGKGYENPDEKGFDPKSGRYFPYDDGTDKPTIGYGHLIVRGEDFSKGLSLKEVQNLFRKDQSDRVDGVNGQLKVGITQNQFDALVSLVFNVGVNQKAPGSTRKHRRTRPTMPVRRLNLGLAVSEHDFTAYAMAHDKKHGKKAFMMPGLAKRRKAEWKIFHEGIYDARH